MNFGKISISFLFLTTGVRVREINKVTPQLALARLFFKAQQNSVPLQLNERYETNAAAKPRHEEGEAMKSTANTCIKYPPKQYRTSPNKNYLRYWGGWQSRLESEPLNPSIRHISKLKMNQIF